MVFLVDDNDSQEVDDHDDSQGVSDDDSQWVSDDASQRTADDYSRRYMIQICEKEGINVKLNLSIFTVLDDYERRVEKMSSLSQTIDKIYNCLEELEKKGDFTMHVENQIQNLKFELRNSRIHYKCGTFHRAAKIIYQISSWVEEVEECFLQPARKGYTTPGLLEERLSKLGEGVIQMKTELFRDGCYIRWLDPAYSDFSYQSALIADVLEWSDQLLDNLKWLIRCNNLSSIVPTKEKIETLVEKAEFLIDFLKIAGMEPIKEAIENGASMSGLLHKTSEDLLTPIKRVIYEATYLSWFSLNGEERRSMDKFFLISLASIDHIEPSIRMIYVQLLTGSKIANPETLGIELLALAAVDTLQKLLKDKDNGSFMHLDVQEIEILCQELGFLKCFLMDPHMKQHNETEAQSFRSLLRQVEAVARELGASLTLSDCSGRIEDHLASLLKIVKLLKLKIREMYLSFQRQLTSNFPRSPKLGSINSFIQHLEDQLLHRADSITYVENEVKTLQSEFTLLKSFIGDTTKNLEKNENIARRIKDVAYEAQQVVELISISHFPKWYYVLWLYDIIEKIKILKKDCLEVHNKMTNESNNAENASSTINPNQGNILSTEEEMVGFHVEAKGIIDQLIGGTKPLDIVSIVGMPGLGKTTLAKKVYEDPSIGRHFHIRSWYCISQEYDRQDLLCSILNDLPQRPPERKDQDKDQELYKRLKGMRYLIVLDDIWSIEPWNDIRNSFPDDSNGSRILFTSRIREVALQANPRSAPPLDLRLLSDEESWELLHNKVFKWRSYPPENYTIGKEIAENCKGLPLSVVVVAGVLVKLEESEDHWKQVLASLSKQVGDKCKCILEMSYKQLPDYLKPCFLYFGAFPEDKAILAWKLFRLWIGEGFIQKKTKDESLENVAEGYLMDLIERNLVLIAESKSIGGVKSCHVHDLLHEFSKEKVKDENFLLISKKMPYDQLEQYRQCFYFNKKSLCGWIPCNPYVRSIFFYPIGERDRIFSDGPLVLSYSLKLLTILNLQGIYMDEHQFQRMTEVLVNLRYLAIEGSEKKYQDVGLGDVPSSVANLRRLETFILSGVEFVTLPEALLEMEYLKYVYVYVTVCCRIRWSDHTEESMSGLSFKSSCIEKFSKLLLDHRTMEKALRRLRSLRKLKCYFFDSCNENGGRCHVPGLELLNKLESLNMTYMRDLDGIAISEFSFPSNLKKLTLSSFRLPWSEISKIRRLPQLKVLKLLYDAFRGQRWDANDDNEFWNLKVLKLGGLDIEEWDASPDVFPWLEKLVVVHCRWLKEIPCSFGESSTLRMIEVKRCRNTVAEAVLKIEEDLQERGATGFKLLIQDPLPESDSESMPRFIRELKFGY